MISVIIPTLNEAENIGRLLRSLSRSSVDHEIIVCDGGSADETISVAAELNAKIINTSPGRGVQLSAGAAASTGSMLLFLHADSSLHERALEQLEWICDERQDIVGGNFRVLYDDSSFFSRFVEFLCIILRPLGMYYGDSGIFVRSQTYKDAGGIRPLEIMEDVDFVLRLERRGKTCYLSSTPVKTSTRRFKRKSPVSLIFLWLRMHFLFACGVSHKQLATIYDAQKTSSL